MKVRHSESKTFVESCVTRPLPGIRVVLRFAGCPLPPIRKDAYGWGTQIVSGPPAKVPCMDGAPGYPPSRLHFKTLLWEQTERYGPSLLRLQ